MSSSASETGGLNLPPPVNEKQPSASEAGPVALPEQAAPVEKAPQRAQKAPIATPPIPMPDPKVATEPVVPKTDDSSTTSNTGIDVKDDGDLIEKEWVNKAKAIVERTKDNPYKQSEELTVVKADYLKKRYDKTLKLNK